MNKKLILIFVSLVGSISVIAQDILPNEATEFCPDLNTTFTVTLPRITNNSTPNVVIWTNKRSILLEI